MRALNMRSDFSAFCMRFDDMPVKQFLRRKGFAGRRRFLAAAMLTEKNFSLNAPRVSIRILSASLKNGAAPNNYKNFLRV